MQGLDLREYKSKIRGKVKQWRISIDREMKAELDRRICRRLLSTYQYQRCDTVMIYASTAIEVDTFGIIEHAFKNGKRVALPRCIPGTREMEFHYITDVSQLEKGSYGVLEPDESMPVCTGTKTSLMVVPALSIDSFGYRLGYGGGYYDRYLSKYEGESIGICYSENYCYRIYHGRYDVPLSAVLTDKFVRRIKAQTGGKHG